MTNNKTTEQQEALEPWKFVQEKCERLINAVNDIRVSRGVIEQHLEDLRLFARSQDKALTALDNLIDKDERYKKALEKIANDPIELSQDKARWQHTEFVKIARQALSEPDIKPDMKS